MEPICLSELLEAVDGRLLSSAPEGFSVTNVQYDSRQVAPGDFFLPLVGERSNGHDFIPQALAAGATGTFTARVPVDPVPGKVYIQVADTATVPRALAAFYIRRFPIPFVAVTGSVGKTTTKDMVAAVLSEKFAVHKTPANHNNALGVPMALLELTSAHQISVIEMGMNSFGEIDALSALVHPSLALITNIGDAHIEILGSRENILKAKCEVFGHMASDAPAILNGDDPLLRTLSTAQARPCLFCGGSADSDYWADALDRDLVNDHLHCTIHTPREVFPVEIPALGDYMIYPVLMAAAVGQHFGMTGAEIAQGILRYAPTKMRMNVVDRGKNVRILDDTYNANPQSMRAAIQTLADAASDYKLALLGDMLELGALGPGMHTKVGEILGEKHIDCLVAIGPLAENIAHGAENAQVPEVYWFPTQEEAKLQLARLIRPNSTILAKASRGMAFEKLVAYLIEITPEKETGSP